MSANLKKSLVSMAALILFGMVAFLSDVSSLVILIPAAIIVWYGVGPALRTGRN